MTSVSEYIVGLVYRQLEEMEATDAAVKAGLAGRRSQRGTGPSVVFSVRLDRTELEALERAAASREFETRPEIGVNRIYLATGWEGA